MFSLAPARMCKLNIPRIHFTVCCCTIIDRYVFSRLTKKLNAFRRWPASQLRCSAAAHQHPTPYLPQPHQRAPSRRVIPARFSICVKVTRWRCRACKALGVQSMQGVSRQAGKRNPVGNQDLLSFSQVSGLLGYSHDSASDGNLKGLPSQSGSNTTGPGLASSSELGAVEGFVGSLAGDESTGGKAGLGGGGRSGLEGEVWASSARHC